MYMRLKSLQPHNHSKIQNINDITIDVIAFDVHDSDANNQLRCTALMTSGKFLNANSQEDLANSLFETVGISKDVKGSIKIPSLD